MDNNKELWIFSMDDPRLYEFYANQMYNSSLYYILYIKKCTRDFSNETKDVLHLREGSILLVDTYMIPFFCRLYLKGYMIILSESFCYSDKNKALLKLCFFHNQPENIIDMGQIDKYQKRCIYFLYKEYCSPYDDLQSPMLRNFLVNLALLSSRVNYEGQFKSGYLLDCALRFIDLINIYAFQERKKSFYIREIGITEKTLDRSLKFIYNKTFKEILTNRILTEAIQLLVSSDKSITQIALELNYNVSGFISLFFKKKGIHPKDFRIKYKRIINDIDNVYEHTTL